jgi:hypothetical protein
MSYNKLALRGNGSKALPYLCMFFIVKAYASDIRATFWVDWGEEL